MIIPKSYSKSSGENRVDRPILEGRTVLLARNHGCAFGGGGLALADGTMRHGCTADLTSSAARW